MAHLIVKLGEEGEELLQGESDQMFSRVRAYRCTAKPINQKLVRENFFWRSARANERIGDLSQLEISVVEGQKSAENG